MFKLGSTNPADAVDIGVYGQYVEGGVTKYQGYFRDQTDNTFKFFTGTTIEPSVTVDTNPVNGFTLGDLLVKDFTSTSASINNATITADFTVDTNTLYVDSSNDRVGINTTGPSYDLDVVGDINLTGSYKINGTDVLSENTLGIGVTQSSLQTFGILDSLTISGDLTVDTDTFYVHSAADRVGINTTAPAFDLDVSGIINAENSYYVDGQQVLTQTGLGSGVTSSSLETVGTLESLVITGDLTVDTNTLYVNSTTNFVGIGTTNPGQCLDVVENNTNGIQIRLEQENVSGRAGIQFNNGSSNFNIQQNGDIGIIENFGGDLRYFAADTGQHRFATTDSNTLRMLINNAGNVAIGGHTSPSFLLDVTAGDINVNDGIYRVNGVEVLSETTLSTSVVNIGPINNLSVTGELNADIIGINNTSPSYELDVSGDINFTGQILNNGAPLVNSDGIWTQQGAGAYLTLGGKIAVGTSNASANLHLSEDYSSGSNSFHTMVRMDADSTLNVQTGFGSAISFRGQRHAIGATYDEIREGGLIENILYSGAGTENDEWQFNFKARDSTGLNSIMTMRGDGLVGIGTTNPTNELEVIGDFKVTNSSTSIDKILTDNNNITFNVNNDSGTNYKTFKMTQSTIGSSLDLHFNDGDQGFNQEEFTLSNVNNINASNRYFQLQYTADTSGLTIHKGGNVGIGTTDPTNSLTINNGAIGTITSFYGPSSTRELRIDNSTTTFDGDTYTFNAISSGGEIAFATNASTERMRINSDGNIGIGISTPSTRLEIEDTAPEFRITDDRIDYGSASGVTMGAISWFSRDTNMPNNYNPTAKILIESDNSTITPDGKILFQTGVNGVLSTSMSINSSSNVDIVGYVLAKQVGASIGFDTIIDAAEDNDILTNTTTTLYLNFTRVTTPVAKVGTFYDFNRNFDWNNGIDDSEIDNGMVSTAPDEMQRFEINTSGLYQINYHVRFESNSSGRREAYLQVNGSGRYAEDRNTSPDTGNIHLNNSILLNLTSSEYITVNVWQDSGGNLEVLGGYLQAILVSSTLT
jgi:hypothetical protein